MTTLPHPDTTAACDDRGDARSTPLPTRALDRLAGRRLLVLNWRDIRHSQAGGAEAYAHQIAKRWVAAGAEVTWLTARDAGQSAHDEIDGITIERAGTTLSVYARSALRLLRRGAGFDAILDCQNGIPFFSPLFTRGSVPVVQLVHHVHQDQFATRFSPTGAAVGRLLEGRVAKRVYEGRRTVAVSASTRQELRRRLKLDGVIEVVPNGCAGRDTGADVSARADAPTIVVTSRLVPHKRIDLLLHAVSAAVTDVPDLQVEIIGDGPELTALRRTAVELGLGRNVRFHGRLPDAERDALMDTAWLTTSTSEGEGWGCVVLEAAASGVPCLALRAAGIRDSVVDGATGWLVDGVDDLAATLPRVLRELADPARAREVADACRRWSGCFSWDRSAELLAGVMVAEIENWGRSGLDDTTRPVADRSALHRAVTRRRARSDMTTLARFRHPDPARAVAGLRLTDEAAVVGDEVTALLRGCDEVDALAVLERLRAVDARVRLASRHELLGGPDLIATAPTGSGAGAPMSPTPPAPPAGGLAVGAAVVPVTASAGPVEPDARATGGTATLLSVSAGLVGLTSYACTLVMAHLLDPAGYTAFAAAAAVVGTAGVASAALIPLPLAHAVRSHPAGSPGRRDAMTFAAGVSVLVGLVAGLLLALVTAGFADGGTAVAAGVSGLALFAIAPVWGHLQGEARFTRYALLTVGEVVARLVASVAAVVAGLGAAGAVGAFVVGALLVLLAATTGPFRALSARALPRVLADRARWAETGGVAATQAVLSTLAVADVVMVAVLLTGPADVAAAAGYQAVAALAKAPVYVAVGTALVSFPALRAATGAARDAHLLAALTTFVRLVVPAAAVVATVPPALVGLVLPASYTPALALLPWLAAGGTGLGATTVLATLLLATGARRALVVGLTLAVAALAAGLAAGVVATGTTDGIARGGAAGALVGALAVGLAGRRHRPRGTSRRPAALGASARRGLVYAVVVLGLFALARPSVVAWVLVVGVVGVAIVATPVVAARLRARAEPADEPVAGPAPGALHVLHLGFEDPDMPGSGGGAKRTGEIDRRLATAGHRVTVVTTRFPGARDRTEVHGAGAVRWIHVGVGRGANRLTRLLGYVARLPFAVRSIDADVVVEDFFAPISSMGVPWFSPRPTAGIVQWLNAREKAREYKLPVHWVERVAVRSHRHLIAMSRGVADQLAALSPRAEITVIGNGVDAAAFDTEVRAVDDRRDVVFVGRLEIAQKGLDLLVDAWARVAPLVEGRLVVAGTGPDEEVLRARVARLGLADRVHFAGWVAGRDKYELFGSGCVAAVPSRFETFGIVAVEALATGTAVVAFDIDCLREVVPTGPVTAGVLVPLSGDHETDVAAYATALHRTLGETDVRATAAARGPQLAAVHDWDALAAAQDAFLRRAAGVGPPAADRAGPA